MRVNPFALKGNDLETKEFWVPEAESRFLYLCIQLLTKHAASFLFLFELLSKRFDGLVHLAGQIDHFGQASGSSGRGSGICGRCGRRSIFGRLEQWADNTGDNIEKGDDSETDQDCHEEVVVLEAVAGAKLHSSVNPEKEKSTLLLVRFLDI